jgi:pimeloyl-ACP methyl ester carboxylesterase
MPFLTLHDSTEIQYLVVGDRGPWVAVLPSGRFSHEDLQPLAHCLASLGHRVLLHDRRNCGQSSLSFDFVVSEDQVWADDLHELLGHLAIDDVVVLGRSRGSRIAVLFAAQHTEMVRGLVLWGLSGGVRTAEVLDDYYFGKYLRACAVGGMQAVVELDHFAAVAGARPENRERLLTMPPEEFVATVERWQRLYRTRSHDELLGVLDQDLSRVRAPTLILPWYDRGHPVSASLRAQRLIDGARFIDFDPSRHGDQRSTADDTSLIASLAADFVADLPRSRDAARRVWPRRRRALR